MDRNQPSTRPSATRRGSQSSHPPSPLGSGAGDEGRFALDPATAALFPDHLEDSPLGHASSDALVQFTDLASTGTKMPRTNWSDISTFKVALPPKPIAAAFTKQIQPMLDCIHANLHQSRTLATLRDTLLPKLPSGELSVADAKDKP